MGTISSAALAMLTGTGGGVTAPDPACGFEPQDVKTHQTIATSRILTLMITVQCNANMKANQFAERGLRGLNGLRGFKKIGPVFIRVIRLIRVIRVQLVVLATFSMEKAARWWQTREQIR
jgi:hypothetical protein